MRGAEFAPKVALPGNAERVVWLLLLIAMIATRFAGLGERTMAHDESIHASMSYSLYDRFEFQHDPAYHGPLLYHVNALVYATLGANDFTARLAPALAGCALLLMAWLFRRYLGGPGAIAFALLMLISPSVLVYSRYLRNDVYIALGSLTCVYTVCRYLETRRRGWLYGLTLALALCAATKENVFLFGATLGSFLVVRGLHGAWRHRKGLRAQPELDAAVWLLALVLPFLSGLAYSFPALEIERYLTVGMLPTNVALIVGTTLLALGLAWFWFGERLEPWLGARPDGETLTAAHWDLAFATFWTIQVVLFTTLLSNVPRGLVSGIVGSVGYWAGEQTVGRGEQPLYYYAMLLALYEFLPVLLGCCGCVRLLRLARRGRAEPLPTVCLLAAWWFVGSAVLYTVAGERMPWLTMHIALPAALLGGWWLAEFVRTLRAERGAGRGLQIAGATVLAALLLLTVRTAWMAGFRNAELPVEPLVYAHGTPDVKQAYREILAIGERTGQGRALPLAVDYEVGWPWVWYLRDFSDVSYFDEAPDPDDVDVPVVLVGPFHLQHVEALLGPDYRQQSYLRMWWPLEDYKNLTGSSLAALLTDAATRRALWRIVWRRDYAPATLDDWPLREEFEMFVRRDLAEHGADP